MSYILYVLRTAILLTAAVGCHGKTNEMAQGQETVTHGIYVSASGSDANKGTPGNPLKSIATAMLKAGAGDTVYVRGGKYTEKLQFKVSGSVGQPVVLMAYPGETPVLDASSFTISGREAVVTFRNIRNIVMQGFDICNYKSSAAWVDVNGIIVDEGCSNITIRKNRIYNIENNATPDNGRSGHGILVIGNTGQVITKILVDSNEIHDCKTGYSENLTINGYVDGFTISHNKVYNAENIGIVAAGGYAANTVKEYNYARNGLISDNELYNIDGTTGPIPAFSVYHGAIAIYVDGSRNIVVERNRIHECDRGIGLVSENADFPTTSAIARNNFVYNCWVTGIYLGGYIGANGGRSQNCYVLNNTLFQNNRVKGYFGEIEGELRLTENCFDNVVANNLVVGREGDLYVHKYTNTGSGNQISHNLYFGPSTASWIWDGNPYAVFTDWVTASGDQASIQGLDPLLVSVQTPDLHIQTGSPAIGMGMVLAGDTCGTVDIDGKARVVNGKISIGAHQR